MKIVSLITYPMLFQASFVHHNIMKLREYFLYAKKKKKNFIQQFVSFASA